VILNTPKLGVVAAALRFNVSLSAPGPTICKLVVIAGSAVKISIEPATSAVKPITSSPACVSAALIASRSVQFIALHDPSSVSAVLVTSSVGVAAAAWSASACTSC
jgi:hypothetical protein